MRRPTFAEAERAVLARIGATLKPGDWTPWGAADYVEPIKGAPAGVVFVGTPSHGGAFVPDPAAESMPEGLRTIGARGARGWWYEEDCAVAAVFLAWPAACESPARLEAARGMAREVYPRHLDGAGCGEVTDTGRGFHTCPERAARRAVRP